MASKRKPGLTNQCLGCGAYVDVGIQRCPNCRAEIINRHAFFYKYQENMWRAIVGVVVGGLFWGALYLAMPAESLEEGPVSVLIGLIPLACAIFGWCLGYQAGSRRVW